MKPYYFVSLAHYYGDIVRKLFFAAAVLMIIGLPFFSDYLPLPTAWSVVAIVVLGLLGGLTNPVKQFFAWVNTCVAGAGVIIFESFAVLTYQDSSGSDPLFLVNQALAIIFLVALYFGTKTLRAMVIEQK